MRIALVDDMETERKELGNRIKLQLRRLSLHAEISEFETGEDFLVSAKKEPFTCVFLDIYMDGMDGIATAKKLRSFDSSCLLVFTTTSAEHALEGFRARAFHYLVKPFSDEELTALFDEITQRLPAPDHYIEIRVTGGRIRLRFQEILYAEHFQHQILIHRTDGQIIATRQTFREFTANLEDERFFLCNRGAIVNLEHAEDFDGTDFLLENGEKVPVSRSLSKEARLAFGDFLFKGDKK